MYEVARDVYKRMSAPSLMYGLETASIMDSWEYRQIRGGSRECREVTSMRQLKQLEVIWGKEGIEDRERSV